MKTILIGSVMCVWLACEGVSLAAQPFVQVLRPNSTDRLQPGATFRVEWLTSVTNYTDWSVTLWTNGVRLGFAARTMPVHEGGGRWHAFITVPDVFVYTFFTNALPSGCNYELNTNDDGSEVNGFSDAFCLGVPALTIRVSQVELCWNSRSNRTYQIQYRSTLTTNAWTNLGTPVQGSGSSNCITDVIVPGEPRKFYRVEELP